MRKSAIAARVLPVLAVAAVMAFSLLGNRAIPFNGTLVSCVGYGYGYGYFPGQPSVFSVNPTTGTTSGGTSVAVTGQGFCNFPASVHFGATAATSFVVNSDTSLTAISPAHAVGAVDVTVTTAAGTSATSSADQYTYGLAWYFNWYDLASAGVNADTIHITNITGTGATGQIMVPGATPITFHVNPGYDGYFAFPQGTIGGPVTIVSNVNIISTLRAWYYQSFNETPARTASQAVTQQIFPWYDLQSAGTRADTIHITDVSGTAATGTIVLGTTTIPFSVASGQNSYFTFPAGTIGGPVVVTSSVPVLASLRAWFNQSFNETAGHPTSSAAMVQYFPWYDKASAGVRADTIHVSNPSGVTATGTIALSGQTSLVVSVAAGQDAYYTFPQGSIGGPVTITTNVGVITALRAWYYQSFNEVAGRAGTAAQTSQFFPWYDLASAGVNADTIHVTNVSGTVANGTITQGATGFISITVPDGSDLYFTFPAGTIGGPVTIITDQPVLASLRAWYYQSFNEVPGY
jgi:hypothetical protein